MKRILFIAITLLNYSTVFGQMAIMNVLTSNHQNIIGTKISLIPPKGFIKATNFLGLQQAQSGSTIMILDIPGPFSEISKGLTKAGFLSQGVEVKEIDNLTINNLPAILATGEQNAAGNTYTKFVLCFGTEKETIMINAVSPNNLKEIGKEIKSSILTSFYEADKKINPLDVVDFEIDVSESKLIFAKSMSNTLVFSADGLLPTKSNDKTSLTVGKSFSKTVIEDRKLYSLNRLKQLPIEIIKIEETNEILIDGISGYEIVATSKDKNTSEPKKVYLVLLFSDSLYYILLGSTNQDFESNIANLKNAVKTFKRK
jgi:hypothetical protein